MNDKVDAYMMDGKCETTEQTFSLLPIHTKELNIITSMDSEPHKYWNVKCCYYGSSVVAQMQHD